MSLEIKIIQGLIKMKRFDNVDIKEHKYRSEIIEIVKKLIDSGEQFGFSDDYNVVKYLPMPELNETI